MSAAAEPTAPGQATIPRSAGQWNIALMQRWKTPRRATPGMRPIGGPTWSARKTVRAKQPARGYLPTMDPRKAANAETGSSGSRLPRAARRGWYVLKGTEPQERRLAGPAGTDEKEGVCTGEHQPGRRCRVDRPSWPSRQADEPPQRNAERPMPPFAGPDDERPGGSSKRNSAVPAEAAKPMPAATLRARGIRGRRRIAWAGRQGRPAMAAPPPGSYANL